MLKPRLTSTLLAVIFSLAATPFAFVTPAPLAAQMDPSPQAPDSIQAMLAEFSEKEQRMSGLQAQVLNETPELRDRQSEIQAMVEAAIRDEEPGFDQIIGRLGELEEVAIAAQASEDMDALMEAMQEAQPLQERLETAQMRALDREPVQEAIETFQSDLLTAMRELDPEVDTILARLEELVEILSAEVGSG